MLFADIPQNSRICICYEEQLDCFFYKLLHTFRPDVQVTGECMLSDCEKFCSYNSQDNFDAFYIFAKAPQKEEFFAQKGIKYIISNFEEYSEIKEKLIKEFVYLVKSTKELTENILICKKQGTHIHINSYSETGLDYLCSLIAKLTGFKQTQFEDPSKSKEYPTNRFYYPEITSLYDQNMIIPTKLLPGIEYNFQIVKKLGISQIFLTRNLFDTMAEVKYYILNNKLNSKHSVINLLDVERLSEEEVVAFVLEHRLKGILRAYSAWYRSKQLYDMDISFISVEDLANSPNTVLNYICAHYNLKYSQDQILKAVALLSDKKALIDSNTVELSAGEREMVINSVKIFKNIDFSLLGVPKSIISNT